MRLEGKPLAAATPPDRIVTPRFVVRVCRPEEAPLLRAAIDMSLDHLRAWLPWAMREPRSLPETSAHLELGATRFRSGEDFQYTIFSADEGAILGGVGLHRRRRNCIEIGYWVRVDRIGQGIATEAVNALTLACSSLPGVERLQIDCDPENHRSRRIPEKLGFELLERRRRDKTTPLGVPRDTLVYELSWKQPAARA